jgi:L-asparaginase II
MLAARGDLVAKGGAEGYHASASLQRGIGLCAKVVDGASRAVSPFVVTTLTNLGALDSAQSEQVATYRRKTVTNRAGTVTGEIYAI